MSTTERPVIRFYNVAAFGYYSTTSVPSNEYRYPILPLDQVNAAVGKSVYNYNNAASSNVELAPKKIRAMLLAIISEANRNDSSYVVPPENNFLYHCLLGSVQSYSNAKATKAGTNLNYPYDFSEPFYFPFDFSGCSTTTKDLGGGVITRRANFTYNSAFFDYSNDVCFTGAITEIIPNEVSADAVAGIDPPLTTFQFEPSFIRFMDYDGTIWRLRYTITMNASGWDQIIITSASGMATDHNPFGHSKPTLVIDTMVDGFLSTCHLEYSVGDMYVKLGTIYRDTVYDQEDKVKPRFQPRTQTSSVGTYILDKTQLNGFASDLWKDDVMETFSTKINGDATNCILSLKWFYGLRSAIPTSSRSHIVLGSVSFIAQGTKAVASSDFVEYDFGSVVVPTPTINDYRAYRAEYRLYMPFIGFIDLNPQDVVGKTLYMRYEVNITDGSAMAQVFNAKPVDGAGGSGSLIFSATCSWGYDIPLRINAVKDAALATAQIATRMATSVIGGIAAGATMGGGVGAAVGGVAGLGMGAMGTMDTPPANSGTQSYSVGSLAPNANVMDDLTAYLVIYQPQYPGSETSAQATAKNTAVGKPSYVTDRVSMFSGYLKAAAVYATSTVPTRHGDEIMALLQSGVYI